MIDLAEAFAELAIGMSDAFGGPYWSAIVLGDGQGAYDDAGVWQPSAPSSRSCSVQIDAATEAMRQADGYADGDSRFLVIGLSGDLGTDARVHVNAGPRAGVWLVSSIERDPMAIGWVGRGCRG